MQMPPQDMENFQKIVLAGMKIMYDEKTFRILKNSMMDRTKPLQVRLAMDSAGLMKMLDEKSGGKIPRQLIAPAGAMLLMEMGKFMAEVGVEKPTPDQIREATGMLMQFLKQLFASAPAGAQPPTGQPAVQPQAAPGGLIQQGAM